MFDWIFKFRYTTIANMSIRWVDASFDPPRSVLKIEALFKINGHGDTKVKFIRGKTLEGYSVKTEKDHSLYTTVIVPWLEGTDWAFAMDREELIDMIKIICEQQEEKYRAVSPQPRIGNVIQFPPKKD